LPDGLPDGLAAAKSALLPLEALVSRLRRALAPELPLFARDGNFIAPGYSAELDEQRLLRDDARRVIADLQARYATETGVQSLKIKHNNVIGYHIEVSAVQSERLASGHDGRFIHRQTLGS